MARRLPAVCVDSNGICCAVCAEITTIADPSAPRPLPIDRVGGRIAGRSPPVAGRTAEALRAVSGQAQVDHQAQRQAASPHSPLVPRLEISLDVKHLDIKLYFQPGSSQAKLFRRSRSGARIRGQGRWACTNVSVGRLRLGRRAQRYRPLLPRHPGSAGARTPGRLQKKGCRTERKRDPRVAARRRFGARRPDRVS